MEKERRGALRIKRPLTVQYGYSPDRDKIKWDMSTVRDISSRGICISADRCFAAGEILYFRIRFPNISSKWIEFKGRVVESKAGGFITRIEFIDLDEDQKHSIQEYSRWFSGKIKAEDKNEL
jgi:hypothetical protein